MDTLPNLQTATLFVEQLYNLIYPYQGFNQAQLTHLQAIQEIEKQLNQLCGREMTAVMVTMLTALRMNPRPNETASMLCQRLRQRLSAADVTLRFQDPSEIYQENIVLEKSPELRKIHRVHSPVRSFTETPILTISENRDRDRDLERAAKEGRLEEVKYLVEIGANIHTRNDAPLRMASEKGHLEIVQYLVAMGANVQARENYALRFASLHGHLPVVKYLVEHGADIHANLEDALLFASNSGNLELVKYLVEHGADIHANNGYILREAVIAGHLPVIKYLVEKGADIRAIKDESIRLAKRKGYLDVTNYLSSL